jgi:hypothetical protein
MRSGGVGAPRAKPGDSGAVGATGIFGARRAAVLLGGLGGVDKAGDRRRQFEDSREVEPVRQLVWGGAGGSGPCNSVGAGGNGLGRMTGTMLSRRAASSPPADTVLLAEPSIGVCRAWLGPSAPSPGITP